MKPIAGMVLGALLCIMLLFPVRASLAKFTNAEWHQESMTYLPKSMAIKPALLGFETTLAHYLWIRTVLYFGEHRMKDQQYPWLIDMLDIITKLCPWFYPAYEFGGLLLPDITNNPQAAQILLERGMTHLGSTRWTIPFYLGTHHLKYGDDRKTAAQYIAYAAFVKGAPKEKLLAMAHTFFTQATSEEEGRYFLHFMYAASENPEVKNFLAEKIRKDGERK